jgi:hypothetical protein
VTRKANARARLKKVDAVIEAVRASGVQTASLVRHYQTSRLNLLLIPVVVRLARWNYRRNMKCLLGINTRSLLRMPKAIARAFIKFPNGRECVTNTRAFANPLMASLPPVDTKDESEGFLRTHCYPHGIMPKVFIPLPLHIML